MSGGMVRFVCDSFLGCMLRCLKWMPIKKILLGLFPVKHKPLVDMTTCRMVQSKIKKPEKTKTIIDDKIPLRGILKCRCEMGNES